jgi:peptidoglycan/xylan/chitin deacetylase (PgdA/CDA1 family)
MTVSERQPWEWDEDVWRGFVDKVRAGRSLRPSRWPGGATAAVAISFDPDHETAALRDGETSPGKLSQGEYGSRVASHRILGVLDRSGVPATFFVPGVVALLHPDEIRSCVAAGHEIGIHGWIHERNTLLPLGVERELTERALATLTEVSGSRPVGIRTASWDFSPETLDIIRELGLTYDSSLMADDEPYEIRADGVATGVVEIPVEWVRDDAAYLVMDRFTSLRPYMPPQSILRIWRDEFDLAYHEGGLFQLTLHPHVSGHRSRIGMLAGLLEHIASKSDVWYATHADVARYVLQAAAPAEATGQAGNDSVGQQAREIRTNE